MSTDIFVHKIIRWENYAYVKLSFLKVTAVCISFVLFLLHTRDFRGKIGAKRKNSILFEMSVGIRELKLGEIKLSNFYVLPVCRLMGPFLST